MLHRITTALACPVFLGLVVFGTHPARAASISTDRVSVSSSGAQANGTSCCGVVSGDGRFVAFDSSAANLSIHPDTNGVQDVFVRDRVAGTTRRVSVSSLGGQANGPSWADAISADGRYIVFRSAATDLVRHDTNHHVDVFVRDLATGRTTRVNDTPGSAQGAANAGRASISANGRFVIFREAYGSACGRYGVFVKDRSAHTLKLVSRKSNGSPMCRFPTPCGPSGQVTGGHVTNSGDLVTFEVRFLQSDCGVDPEVVVRDRSAGHTHVFDGPAVDSDVSPDGRFLVWAAGPFGGLDVLLRDRVANTTIQVTGTPNQAASGFSGPATVSDDGALVAFDSTAPDLVAGDTNSVVDVFLRDVAGATTARLSVRPAGGQLTAPSLGAAISADGRYVVFDSFARTIVHADTNNRRDVFVRGPLR
jgi:Tol biopolymer transport system component